MSIRGELTLASKVVKIVEAVNVDTNDFRNTGNTECRRIFEDARKVRDPGISASENFLPSNTAMLLRNIEFHQAMISYKGTF